MRSRHSIKILGLTLVAAIGLMAVNAVAAQAVYQLRRGGASVASINLVASVLLSELIAENGLRIHCAAGTGNTTITGGGTSAVAETALVLFEGCVWKGSEKTCTITNGGITGRIHTDFGGKLSMVGQLYLVLATDESLAVIHTTGPFCTIPEEEVISGGVLLDILNAETDATDHLVHVENHGIVLGESEAKLTSEAHVKEISGATWGIRLTGL